jgi:hypothetical protein
MGVDVLWLQKGSVPLPTGLSAEDGLARLEDALVEDGVDVHRDASNRLVFQANVFVPRKLFRWTELQPYNRGELTIEPVAGRLVARYRFSLSHLFWCCLLGAALMGLVATSHSAWDGAKIAGLAFGWVYGGNYLIGLIRASAFVASALFSGETEEHFSAADKMGCSLILALILAIATWAVWAAYG